MFLFFSKFSFIIYWGNFILRTLPLSAPLSFSKSFHPLGDLYFAHFTPFQEHLFVLKKNACSFIALKFSYSTTLKCIIIHVLHIHILPKFTCKNMANYFIAGWVFATISSNNLPFRTPYITPIVTTWNIQFSMFCNLNFDYTWL